MSRHGWNVARTQGGPMVSLVARSVAIAIVMGGLAGCSMVPDWAKPGSVYGEGGTPAPTQEGTTGFPELADVPGQKPATTSAADQKTIANSLAADRASARHSDEVLRGGTEPPAPAPQISAPKPVPVLKDVPADTVDPQAEQQMNDATPSLPMPGRGGHSSLEAAKGIQTAAVDMSAQAQAQEPAPAAKPDPNAEQPVNAAPTTPVVVKPTVDGGSAQP